MLAMASKTRSCWDEESSKAGAEETCPRIEEIRFTKDRLCGACEAGKITKAKHPAKTIMKTTCPLELLHMDLFGPPKYSSFGGNVYDLVIVDDFSRYT